MSLVVGHTLLNSKDSCLQTNLPDTRENLKKTSLWGSSAFTFNKFCKQSMDETPSWSRESLNPRIYQQQPATAFGLVLQGHRSCGGPFPVPVGKDSLSFLT